MGGTPATTPNRDREARIEQFETLLDNLVQQLDDRKVEIDRLQTVIDRAQAVDTRDRVVAELHALRTK